MSGSNEFPTVATIIGCPEQLSSANGLVATPLTIPGDFQPDDTSQVKDPVQRAVLDNICGKLPTKTPVKSLKCDVCNIECNGSVSFQVHMQGAKHQKKLKEQNMKSFAKLPFIIEDKETKTFQCKYCNTTLNAISQIEAHIEGSKHKSKTKTTSNEQIIHNVSNNIKNNCQSKQCADSSPKLDTNINYCSICNIHTNSKLQLAQHAVSQKHMNKVKAQKQGRYNPYKKSGNWDNNYQPKQNGGPFSKLSCGIMTLGTGTGNYQRPWVRESDGYQYNPTPSTQFYRRKNTLEDRLYNGNLRSLSLYRNCINCVF
ncbi:zinc finger protein 346-like isoform X2 [Cimex lectularius]|uniref:C2H2-type domain-containing protein n=1 Tax=Cimex lectularius TaxID=79782 RepID=A0A8I6S1D0_CIMLE|nr:zinc finger protein 346-like isoform X2 [Cimex lectularius]